jgi:hypothetical protein
MIWYIDHLDKLQNRKLGRYLGPSYYIGQAMDSRILTSRAQVLSRTSVLPLSIEDTNSDSVKAQITQYDEQLKITLGERAAGLPAAPEDAEIEHELEFDPYTDETEIQEQTPDTDDIDFDSLHNFISAHVSIPVGGELHRGTVIGRKRDRDGKTIGKSHTNPLLDTSFYNVEFEDGTIEAYAANQIVEAIYSQVDTEGNQFLLLAEIVDHKKLGDALSGDDAFVEIKGRRVPKKTTKGWKFLVRWKDSSTQWIRLADLKESNPVELAEYAVGNKLVHEPAFQWWVPCSLHNQKAR